MIGSLLPGGKPEFWSHRSSISATHDRVSITPFAVNTTAFRDCGYATSIVCLNADRVLESRQRPYAAKTYSHWRGGFGVITPKHF